MCYSPKDPEETEKLATKDHLISLHFYHCLEHKTLGRQMKIRGYLGGGGTLEGDK